MIKTKLILVDGITGSGKSTTTHLLYRHMLRNGVKVKWIYEVESDHPLFELIKTKDETDIEHSERAFKEIPEKWVKFVEKIKDDEYVYIVESYLFQDVLMFPHFMNDIDRDRMKQYSHSILKIAEELNPVLIHYYQNDVAKALRGNWRNRGREWTDEFIKSDEKTLYCKNRKIKGRKASIQLWSDFTKFTLELFDEYKFRKIQFENSDHDYNSYMDNILNFLKLKKYPEIELKYQGHKFDGDYIGTGMKFKIYKKGSYFYLDTFWPGLRLLQVSNNEFEILGFPISLKIYRYKKETRLKITESKTLFKAGTALKKYEQYILSEKEVDQYCGEWYCEAEKLKRKIFRKKGKMYYYWYDKDVKCELIPVAENKFIKLAGIENMITFKKVKGKWQYSVWDKGYKSNAVFVKKKDSDEDKEK
ncbi:MAG: hypothetical protein JXN63_02325 [Candidatus Delongbacteria bacterium]|nr:hypothetical protein [Candidatus Delongbacteria bacterium]